MSSDYSPKVFAHRGSNKLAPENSKPAFDLALIEGADGFETDIQFSKDSVPLLWHDDEMKRIGMPNKSTNQYLWEELELLDISLLSNNFHRFCGMVSLDSFLHSYYGKIPLLFEIKEMPKVEDSLVEKNIKIFLNRLIAAYIKYDSVMISSFDITLLKLINKFSKINFLVANIRASNNPKNFEEFIKENQFLKAICLDKSLITPDTITTAKNFGLKTLAYTCNSEDDLTPILASKVDIIISDIPGECKKMVNRILNNK